MIAILIEPYLPLAALALFVAMFITVMRIKILHEPLRLPEVTYHPDKIVILFPKYESFDKVHAAVTTASFDIIPPGKRMITILTPLCSLMEVLMDLSTFYGESHLLLADGKYRKNRFGDWIKVEPAEKTLGAEIGIVIRKEP